MSLDDIQTAIKTKFLQVKGDKNATSQRKNFNMKFKKGKKVFQNKKNGDVKSKSEKKSGSDFV